MSIILKELAEICDARIVGGNPDALVDSAADIMSAGHRQITLLTDARYRTHLQKSEACACLTTEKFVSDAVPPGLALLICADPEMAFIEALNALHPPKTHAATIAPQAVVADDSDLGREIHVGPYAVIGKGTRIGDGSSILAGVYVGDNVTIGKNCTIHPYAVIYDDTRIGDNVIIHSGAIIGADGFGYKYRDNRHVKVPQVGNVVIEDNVEIGANTCIDRGALGSTHIGWGSKIDNLVQVGHNNRVGKNVIMCGQTGVSGSCEIEDGVILAGSAGVADHVKIGRGAVVLARSGVATDVQAGTQVFGSPAKEKKVAYKEQVALAKLPELMKKVKTLEEKLAALTDET